MVFLMGFRVYISYSSHDANDIFLRHEERKQQEEGTHQRFYDYRIQKKGISILSMIGRFPLNLSGSQYEF